MNAHPLDTSLSLPSLVAVACCCACASGPRPAEATAPSSEAPAKTASAGDRMLDHFADATAARDAVIAGRLQAVRPPLERLAGARDIGELPSDWMPWFDEMRKVAARGAAASTLAAAAESVAALGGNCGECHRTTRGGPRTALAPEYNPGGERGLRENMARHRFAADELWIGLTGPVHEAWSTGASALMNINVPSLVTHRGDPATEDRAPSGEGTLQGEADPAMPSQEAREGNARSADPDTVDLDPELRALRALGERADRATTGADKQQVFGEVIARCGACHERLNVVP
jgi:mono/diheme cytochrome c family protein